jgi:hypothetical protein
MRSSFLAARALTTSGLCKRLAWFLIPDCKAAPTAPCPEKYSHVAIKFVFDKNSFAFKATFPLVSTGRWFIIMTNVGSPYLEQGQTRNSYCSSTIFLENAPKSEIDWSLTSGIPYSMRTYGRVEVQLHTFLISTLYGGIAVTLLWGKITLYP